MRRALVLLATLAPCPALAQDGDQGYLAAFLQDSLSDAGRTVTITGFQGALSSTATLDSLTIADDLGIWLTITGATLDWSRSSLLSGELVVNQLSADSITLHRLPQGDDSSLPAPEAGGFSLPDLPVSIDISTISAGQIILGETVLGQPVTGRLDATLHLADGAGQASLDLKRTDDGPTGQILLQAEFDNASGHLDLNLSAGEGAGGIVATLLGLPDTPATDLSLQGEGPLTDFAAQIRLATAGQERLSGGVTLSGPDGRIRADLAGNLAPLFLPDYAGFLGDRLTLRLDAHRTGAGGVIIDDLSLLARSLVLQGNAVLAGDGRPESINLTGTVADPSGAAVLLPLGGTETRIGRAEFTLSTRAADGPGWTALARITGLDRADLTVDYLGLTGSGRFGRSAAGDSLGGTINLTAAGVLPSDPGLATALGQDLQAAFKFHKRQADDALRLSDLTLTSAGLTATAQLAVNGLDSALTVGGTVDLAAEDLSRFALLTGQTIAGAGTVHLTGSASALSGALDVDAQVRAQDLRLGQDQIDRMLAGESLLHLSLRRDGTGTALRALDLTAPGVTLTAKGRLATTGSDLEGEIVLPDLSPLGPDYGGTARLQAEFAGTLDSGSLTVTGETTDLRPGLPDLDPLLTGRSTLTAGLSLAMGRPRLTSIDLTNAQLGLLLEPSGEDETLTLTARLANLGLLLPDFQGPLTVTGTLGQTDGGYALNLSGRGPGQVDGRLSGSLDAGLSTADLLLSGTGQAALANLFIAPRALDGALRYDLRLKGPIAVSGLTGRVTLANGRLSDPSLGFALQGIEAMAELAGGKADVALTASLSSGGRLRADGKVGLTSPYPGTLALNLDRARLTDPSLYESILSGALTITGGLAGGATVAGDLSVSEANLRVPESGLDGSGALLDVAHLHEPADVRATRQRAGLIGGTGQAGSAGGSYTLDLTISAPSRIFLRGRGIDAELGGTMHLSGSTDSVVPSGAFNLIRGRLEILGKRLELDKADLLLEGRLVPTLDIAASVAGDGVTSYVTLTGPADQPVVAFSSSPELPQEEVLAQILFGHGLANISALQAAQLAQAVAVLAGRSGESLIGKLRKGFGLDDLDLVTADDGTTALTVGKYLADNIYTEVEIDQTGQSQINLNLDLRPGVTVKGRVGADGETGFGLFIEQDY